MPKNIVFFDKARTRLICLAQFLLRHLFLNVNIANYWQFLLMLINKDRTSSSVSSRFESVQNNHIDYRTRAPRTCYSVHSLRSKFSSRSNFSLRSKSLITAELMSLMLKRTMMTIQFPRKKNLNRVNMCGCGAHCE